MPSIKNFFADNDPSSPLDEKVMMMLSVAVLAYFVGDWIFTYIDQTFFAVTCKAKYFAAP